MFWVPVSVARVLPLNSLVGRFLCLFCTEASNQQLIDLGTISSDSASMLHILRPLVVLIFCFSFNLVQADIYLYGARHEVVRLSTFRTSEHLLTSCIQADDTLQQQGHSHIRNTVVMCSHTLGTGMTAWTGQRSMQPVQAPGRAPSTSLATPVSSLRPKLAAVTAAQTLTLVVTDALCCWTLVHLQLS